MMPDRLEKFRRVFEDETNRYDQQVGELIKGRVLKKTIFTEEDFLKYPEYFVKDAKIYFLTLLGSVKNKEVLDIGCGVGDLSLLLSTKGAHVTGIDISRGMIDLCKMRAERYSIGDIDFRQMNALDLKFDRGSFDIVIGAAIVHHIPDLRVFFEECKRVLKSGGFILFEEPQRDNPIVQFNRKFMNPSTEKFIWRTRWEHPLTKNDLKTARMVFGNIYCRYFYLFSPLAFVFRMIFHSQQLFNLTAAGLKKFDGKLERFRFLRRLYWTVVFKCFKEL
jgi:2-polyprenyl-3-methyl-5-hydroxy-6-metoxy-1,4-benzoquinol methylase